MKKIGFEQTMRDRYPRKTKKFLLKRCSRSTYHDAMHFKERIIEAQANHYKQLYNTPHPEIDAIVAELMESVKSQPKNMSREEEVAYMLGDSEVSQ